MSENKRIRFGIKNAHAAFLNTDAEAGGKPSYKTPVAIPGAKSFSAEPTSENFVEYADDIEWTSEDINNGYSITLEFEDTAEADEFLTEALGQTKDGTSGMVSENANDVAKTFALLGEFTLKSGKTTDAKGKRFCFYNCKASRPTISGETKQGTTLTVATNSVTITALPRESDGEVKATSVSTDAGYENWFKSVPEKTAAAA